MTATSPSIVNTSVSKPDDEEEEYPSPTVEEILTALKEDDDDHFENYFLAYDNINFEGRFDNGDTLLMAAIRHDAAKVVGMLFNYHLAEHSMLGVDILELAVASNCSLKMFEGILDEYDREENYLQNNFLLQRALLSKNDNFIRACMDFRLDPDFVQPEVGSAREIAQRLGLTIEWP